VAAQPIRALPENKTALTSVKIDVFAAIAKAIDSTAAKVNFGTFRKDLAA